MKGSSAKPEYMTLLSGERMVSKTDGRIAFRGSIDSLEAEVIEAQLLAAGLGENENCARLGELLDYLRKIMAAEVKETPLSPPEFFGMDAAELHRKSHEGPFRLPSYTHGALAVRINLLRTKVREAELLAVKVFGPQDPNSREDLVLALNRLSSALWWLFLRCSENRH